MDDFAILDTLQTAVTAAVDASIKPDLDVKYIGRTFTPPNSQQYLEVVFLPNNRPGDFIADGKNYAGVLRLVLHWPADEQGASVPGEVLASICSYFIKGNQLDGVQIADHPNLTGVLEQGVDIIYPASIRYVSFRL